MQEFRELGSYTEDGFKSGLFPLNEQYGDIEHGPFAKRHEIEARKPHILTWGVIDKKGISHFMQAAYGENNVKLWEKELPVVAPNLSDADFEFYRIDTCRTHCYPPKTYPDGSVVHVAKCYNREGRFFWEHTTIFRPDGSVERLQGAKLISTQLPDGSVIYHHD